MKKKVNRALFASTSALVAIGLMPLTAAAQNKLTVYGRIDLDVESQRTTAASAVKMVDNSSRLGVRGVEDLDGGLKAVFGLEQAFAADTGVAPNPMYRNAYVGLTSEKWGSLAMGRLDNGTVVGSPVHALMTRNITLVIHDAGTTGLGTKVFNGRNRVSNAIGYASPTWSGLTVRARMNLAGPDPATPAATGPVKSEGDFRQYDVGIAYEKGALSAGLGLSKDSKKGGLSANNFDRKVLLIGSYKMTPVTIYAAYGQDRYIPSATSRSEVTYWLTGVSWSSGPHQVMANYMERDVQLDRQGKLKKAQIGYRYQLSKRTTPYLLLDREDPNSNIDGDHSLNFGIGVAHFF